MKAIPVHPPSKLLFHFTCFNFYSFPAFLAKHHNICSFLVAGMPEMSNSHKRGHHDVGIVSDPILEPSQWPESIGIILLCPHISFSIDTSLSPYEPLKKPGREGSGTFWSSIFVLLPQSGCSGTQEEANVHLEIKQSLVVGSVHGRCPLMVQKRVTGFIKRCKENGVGFSIRFLAPEYFLVIRNPIGLMHPCCAPSAPLNWL